MAGRFLLLCGNVATRPAPKRERHGEILDAVAPSYAGALCGVHSRPYLTHHSPGCRSDPHLAMTRRTERTRRELEGRSYVDGEASSHNRSVDGLYQSGSRHSLLHSPWHQVHTAVAGRFDPPTAHLHASWGYSRFRPAFIMARRRGKQTRAIVLRGCHRAAATWTAVSSRWRSNLAGVASGPRQILTPENEHDK